MATRLGRTCSFPMHLVDTAGNGVVGLTLANFVVTRQRNGINYPSLSLLLTEQSNGHYTLSFTPTEAGEYTVDLLHPATGIRYTEDEEFFSDDEWLGPFRSTVLTDTYLEDDSLRVIDPYPQRFRIYVFPSEDWELGRQAGYDSVGETPVDENGAWVNPITVTYGTYHIVAVGPHRTRVLAANLVVGTVTE